MKIALMHPRFTIDSNIPLGIGYISSYLKAQGINSEIIDLTFSGRKGLEERLLEVKPDILGLSVVSTNFQDAIEISSFVRSVLPSAKIVFGGPQATVMKEKCFDFTSPDVVVIGEGELTFHEVVLALKNNSDLADVKGIIYKKEGRILQTAVRQYIADLDILPFPSREKYPMEHYLQTMHGRISWAVEPPALTMISSRGCPFPCTYCSSHCTFGRKVRTRSVDNVMAEIDHLVKTYHIKGLYFWDDTFVLNKSRVLEICKRIKQYNLSWYCQTRADTADEEMLLALKGSGCATVSLGVESGSQRILDEYLKKGIKLDQIRNTVKLARKLGFMVHNSFMIGTPGETKEDIEKTIAFAKELSPDVIEFNITTPYYGTEMREIIKREGTLLSDEIFGMNLKNKSVFKTEHLTPELVSKMYKKATRSFYFRPRYIFQQLASIRSFKDLKRKLRGFMILLQTLGWGN
jgi:anaerobic magnesium-protoporphyrin IX monomethyl ester cyclase